ncbi:16S rRNA (cytosine(967)-C(5))-methyltransferase RsmB [Stenotrophomonas maltophilia]|uniref:16S rRNA (cytosine(967)-C(5))-methyltransferase RsmB n=1 Tax=Stenotrophomonas maltophilia TaxID=40324 RepID=UPI001239E79A|nr:16S rRNA (cytosine(967)-C(5))-methyltransferase RsmB [Stenotrophomonas maltophilia]QEU32210.1 16S rRNA (cytosine(967)-C(5))-methyltransferase RsmB [Stenotrophomonas maltophilia]
MSKQNDFSVAKAAPGAATRMLAARVLAQVFTRGRSLKAELAWALPKLADSRDRALLEALCFAVLRRRSTYDAALQAWMQKPLSARDADLRTLLMVGFAQLDVLELPAHDAFPEWLADAIERDWPAQAEAIFSASLQPAPLWLRANRQHGGRDKALATLAEAGIAAEATALCADALRLATPVAVNQLPGFGDGALSVQDLSAQCAADALAPATGARVLDACAAPGGKSAHLLERDPSLRLLALDIDARRLARARDTYTRTGVGEHAQTLVADASDPGSWWDGVPFDAILLDAPCSATGVIRRQPDVMFHRRAEDVDALVGVQARLLEACWSMLRPGGVLLYATCSILRAENIDQVRAFLKWHPDAVAQPLGDAFGVDCEGVARQRLPGDNDADGFFYARLIKAA